MDVGNFGLCPKRESSWLLEWGGGQIVFPDRKNWIRRVDLDIRFVGNVCFNESI